MRTQISLFKKVFEKFAHKSLKSLRTQKYKFLHNRSFKSSLQTMVLSKDGSTVRSEFAYYVPRIFNRTVPAYRTSVQFLKRTVPTYRTRTITKKAYRTA